MKNNIGSIVNNLNKIVFEHKVPTDEQATQQALEHYSSTPTRTLLEERAILEAQQPWRCTYEPLVQPSENKAKKKSSDMSVIKSVGSFLFKCERPKTRATAGFIIAAAGSGLAYTALTPKLVLMLLGAALTPHVTAALLAVGLFLAAVGTAMFIHGLIANCRQAKSQPQVYRPDYNSDVSNTGNENLYNSLKGSGIIQ